MAIPQPSESSEDRAFITDLGYTPEETVLSETQFQRLFADLFSSFMSASDNPTPAYISMCLERLGLSDPNLVDRINLIFQARQQLQQEINLCPAKWTRDFPNAVCAILNGAPNVTTPGHVFSMVGLTVATSAGDEHMQ